MLKREFLVGGAALTLWATIGGQSVAETSEAVNVDALAALRPCMPMSTVEKAMGSAWRAPPPHKGGVIDILEKTHGVTLRLDRNGMVGEIGFNSRFMHTVAGIPMGIPLSELRSAVPDMLVGEESKANRGAQSGTKRLPEGILTVRITFGRVYGISIANPNAKYSEPTAPPYAVASGSPGAPFSDVNLKLAVMSSLLDAKLIDLGTPDQLASHVLGHPVDLEVEGYALIPQAFDYLTRYPLSEELLASVERIELDGGATIYPFAWYFWDGEDKAFDIKDLSGLRFCPNLKTLSVISMIDRVDIRALVALKHLEKISIKVPTENEDVLLDLPSLKQADSFSRGGTAHSILEKLRERGVEVR